MAKPYQNGQAQDPAIVDAIEEGHKVILGARHVRIEHP